MNSLETVFSEIQKNKKQEVKKTKLPAFTLVIFLSCKNKEAFSKMPSALQRAKSFQAFFLNSNVYGLESFHLNMIVMLEYQYFHTIRFCKLVRYLIFMEFVCTGVLGKRAEVPDNF